MAGARNLDETQVYQSILAGLTRLNDSVRLDPDDFAKTFLEDIDETLWDLVDSVSEGTI